MGYEGANVLFDTLIHPLVMGLEEHLLTMFREDFEFHDAAGPSHHGGHAPRALPDSGVAQAGSAPPPAASPQDIREQELQPRPASAAAAGNLIWLAEAEQELKKIPFFVRGKARRNTETYATRKGLHEVSLDTLYEAKAHFAR
jgi:light-independent protochlorophyllide reductase subunit B